jgi:hypothetical protein
MRNALLGMCGVVAAVSVAGSALGAADINGGTSWGGWQSVGQSNDLGRWGVGPTTGGYSIYTTSFFFANQTVTGSPVGSADLSGWGVGARILGVGIQGPNIVAAQGPFFKFDLNSDSYQAASTVGGNDGAVGTGFSGHVGDFNVQVNGDNNAAYQPNFISVLTTDGTFWGGTAAFQGYGQGIPPIYARSFFDVANGSLQVLFNLDLLSGSLGIGTIGNSFRMVTAAGADGGQLTQSVFDVNVVPAPGALALLGVAGLMGRRRRN